MEKVLVTGGAGFVGSALVPALLERGYDVEIFDNLSHENSYSAFSSYVDGKSLLSHDRLSLTRGDIRHRDLISESVSRNDYIIHLAAVVGAPACDKTPELARTTNLDGTRNILENISENQRLIFASTGSNYGAVEGICTEDTPLNPLSIYGETKTQAEREVMDKEGVAYRFATAFGIAPRYRMDLLVNDFAYRIVNNQHLDVYEAGARRTFIHVSDMVEATLFGMENYGEMAGEAFNVGDERMNMTKGDVAKRIVEKAKDMLGIDPYLFAPEGDERKDPDARDYEVSYEKIQNVGSGFRTSVSLDDGFKELIEFSSFIKLRNPFGNT